jgi:hypothetical protein
MLRRKKMKVLQTIIYVPSMGNQQNNSKENLLKLIEEGNNKARTASNDIKKAVKKINEKAGFSGKKIKLISLQHN